MTRKSDNTELIIRFSGTWWIYMVARGGALRAVVNGVEDILAVTGRTLLLIFLIYCGIKSGALLVTPDWHAPDWLEMLMFALQLTGLEGSIPGLARHADILRRTGDEEGAKKTERVMRAARWMTILAIGEGVLHLIGFDATLLKWISGILLVARGVVITGFLIELAKLDGKGPKVLSKEEYEQEQEAEASESEQARTIADLRDQLTQAQAALQSVQQQRDAREIDHIEKIEVLRNQIASMEQVHAITLSSTNGQTQLVADLQLRLQNAEQQTANLTALLDQKCRELETANLQLLSATSELQTAKIQITDLQNAVHQPAKRKGADLQNITSIDQVRAKYEAGKSREKLSHAQILEFIEEHPELKRVEVAAQLGISERKVYDAVAWRREQEPAKSSAR